MSIDFALPQMGFDMTEAKIARWAKKEGERVEPGEVLAEIATEKVNLELVDHPGGLVEKILVPEGETVAIGTPIVRLGDAAASQQPAEAEAPVADGEEPGEAAAPASSAAAATEMPASHQPETTQLAQPLAQPESTSKTPPSAAHDDAAHDDAAHDGAARLKASPLARRLAEEKGVDLHGIQGSGPFGRILRDDVLQHTAHASTAQQPAPTSAAPTRQATSPASAPGAQELSPMRQAIARRMQESKQQIPHFYITTEVRVDAALAVRAEINKAGGDTVNISVNDLVLKATAIALARHPGLNAWFAEGKIRTHDRINVGVAVALDEGLIVPALLDCQNRSLGQISAGAKELVQRARKGAVKPEEFTGGTFTVSNLGMFGVDSFQAIINPPQVGILAVGAAKKQPVVEEDSIVVGTVMQICLSCDHRATDGAVGARFLAEIKNLLENPMLMLL